MAKPGLANHRQGIGDTLENRHYIFQCLLRVAAFIEIAIELGLGKFNLFRQGFDQGVNHAPVVARDQTVIHVHQCTRGQSLVELVVALDRGDTGYTGFCHRQVVQQIFEEHCRKSFIERADPLLCQLPNVRIYSPQEAFHRWTTVHHAGFQASKHGCSDSPHLFQAGAPEHLLQAVKHLQQLVEINCCFFVLT